MENKPVTPAAQALAPAVSEIRALLKTSRKSIAQQVNQELLSTYWKIGEVHRPLRAERQRPGGLR